jgi:uncharacterized SAM-binding protein YcdF (DUF218 family)
LNALVHVLIHPVFLLWCLILAGIFFYLKSKLRALRIVVIASIFWLFIITVSPIPIWIAAHLEQKYPPVNIDQVELKPPVRIMVLGAGHTNDPELPNIDKLYPGALARLAEGIRIHKMIEGSQLICSGYADRFDKEGTLILITDAIHMPRAMKWFHKQGVYPIAAPTNHSIKIDPDRYDFPFKFSTNKIILMEKSLHEYVGMLAR